MRGPAHATARRRKPAPPKRDTLVFIPAWNEYESLGAVLVELQETLPEVDVLVIDDGSTDGTATLAREAGAAVERFDRHRGLRAAVEAGYTQALDRGYRYCGRIDADGQHPAAELHRLLEHVRSGASDVAVGSRFVSADGYEPDRYRPSTVRSVGIVLLRRAIRIRLGHPFADATSGMWAVNERALPCLSERYRSGAPEVESLLRLSRTGLVVDEVAVDMRARMHGESKLRGARSVRFVLTVVAALIAAEALRRTMRRSAAR